VAPNFDFVLGEREGLTGCDPELLFHEIDAGDELGCGVFHLEPRVHLEVVEPAVLVQELDGARVDIVATLGDLHRRLTHGLDDLVGNSGRGRFLDEFLVASLRGAVAGAEMDAVAVAVGENLHLDMARLVEIELHVALVAPEIAGGFALGGIELGCSFVGGLHHLHPSSAAAVGRLDRHRPAVGVAEGDDLVRIGDQIRRAGDPGDIDLLGRLSGRDLVAHHVDRVWRRTDEGDATLGDGTSEVGVFGEEAVAGMDCVGTAAFYCRKDGIGVEVGLGGGLATEGVSLIGKPNMEGLAIEVAVDSDGADAEFAARTYHSDRDLSTVGDENFRKHVLITSPMNPSDATPEPKAFPLSTVETLSAGFGRLRHVPSTGSTNVDLADEARSGLGGPAVLVADFQQEGRGRLDRVWEAAPGRHLLVSFRVPADARAAPEVVGAVAAAAREAAGRLMAPAVWLKWPNDLVVIDGPKPGKLAGVLAEFVPGREAAVVVGIGVNVGPTTFEGATSLFDCGGDADRDRLLAALIQGLPDRLADHDALTLELRCHSATLGTRVRVTFPDGRLVTGMAVDLDAEGRLVVDDGVKVHIIAVGDVIHLRSDT